MNNDLNHHPNNQPPQRMSPMENLSLAEMVQRIQSRQMSAQSLMERVYANIEQHNPKLNAYREVLPKQEAMKRATQVDERAAAGEKLGKLAGLPIAVKDNISTQDPFLKTVCASKLLDQYNAPYNAQAVEKLLAEDAIIIGKTNMDEFAMGSSTENSAYGVTRNPFDPERVPGGSSGGSAVCVAADMAVASLGSDTGGSIRQPASFCGLTGSKPTYGAVSRYGLVAYGSSLDQIGCLTKTAEDNAYLLSIITGPDDRDATSLRSALQPVENLPDASKLKIGLPKEFFEAESANPEVIARIHAAAEQFKAMGATVETCSVASMPHVIPVYYIIAFAEASSNLGRYDGIRYGQRKEGDGSLKDLYATTRSEGFGEEVKRRIMLGTFVLSAGYYDAYYGKANLVRRMIEQEVTELLQTYDFILGPTSPFPPFKIGEKMDDPLTMYLADIYTVFANVTGHPAINIQAGTTSDGLPVGAHLIGRKQQDHQLLAAARLFQKHTDHHHISPDLTHN